MIYDRPYMRQETNRGPWSVVIWLIVITGVAYILQHLVQLSWENQVKLYAGLSVTGIRLGYVWTLLSYGLLHDGMLHILFNMLGLFFLGRALLPIVGTGRFVTLYVGSMLVGALAWLSLHFMIGANAVLFGASGAIFGLLAALMLLMPDVMVTLIPIPITLKPKHILWGAIGINVLGLGLSELSGNLKDGTAYSAHLGGMLAGWLYARVLHDRTGEFGSMRPSIELPAWLRKRRRVAAAKPTYSVNVTPPVDLKAEVDRILDKINSQGFGSLTEEERRMLDEARDLLNKR